MPRIGDFGHPLDPKTRRIYHAYISWCSMKQRTRDPNSAGWNDYGGRGIRVCKAWQRSFRRFLADMGPRPIGCTLDRIDVNGDYKPSNTRWATLSQQARNKRAGRTARGCTVSSEQPE